MTQFTRPSFSVAVAGGDGSFCQQKGHAMPDISGRCIACGESLRETQIVRLPSDTPRAFLARNLTSSPLHGVIAGNVPDWSE